MDKAIDNLLDTLVNIDYQALKWEIRKQRAIRSWALAQSGIDFVVGDQVQIVEGFTFPESLDNGAPHGWNPYREALSPGATAVVRSIDFNILGGYWYADIRLDREWSTTRHGATAKRFWRGAASETPEGMEVPKHPDPGFDYRGVFRLRASNLRKCVVLSVDPNGPR